MVRGEHAHREGVRRVIAAITVGLWVLVCLDTVGVLDDPRIMNLLALALEKLRCATMWVCVGCGLWSRSFRYLYLLAYYTSI
jgi:hypothetical protein